MAKGEVEEAMKELKAKMEEKPEAKPDLQNDIVDEDQRKLFVGGLAQVGNFYILNTMFNCSFLYFNGSVVCCMFQDAKDTDIKEYFGKCLL